MKLLFDQNLSPRLVIQLSDVYPGSSHVSLLGLDRSYDDEVWQYAAQNGYFIVTKDVDFNEMSVVRGFPPKVIWLRLGNCTTRQVELTLRNSYESIRTLEADPDVAVLTLF
ncbi:MAG TPA: DUF5615 family PIN-like protein [Ardenticatenaceae bacterium]